VAHLEELGTGGIVVPRSSDYDLREKDAVVQLYEDHLNTDILIHLAATVGGIGVNRDHPGIFFYDNMDDRNMTVGIRTAVSSGKVCWSRRDL
jgi:nucleoside-diphosphate-sugar epimerase